MRIVNVWVALAAVVVVGAVIVVFLLVNSVDSLVKKGIEAIGSELTGTQVTVDSVSIALTEGRGAIAGIHVANPPGFPAGDAFSLGKAELALDLGSIHRNPLVLESVTVEAPVIHYIRDPSGKANLDAILDHLKQSSGESPESPKAKGEEVRFQVRQFTFKEGELHAAVPGVLKQDLDLKMPPLEMTDLGGRDGATGPQIGRQVLSEYGRRILTQISRSSLESLIDQNLKGETGAKIKGLLHSILK